MANVLHSLACKNLRRTGFTFKTSKGIKLIRFNSLFLHESRCELDYHPFEGDKSFLLALSIQGGATEEISM